MIDRCKPFFRFLRTFFSSATFRVSTAAAVAAGAGAYLTMDLVRFALSHLPDTDQIQVAVAAAFAVWTSWLIFAAAHLAALAGTSHGHAGGVPMMQVPMLIPEYSEAGTWVQPAVEDGDRLMEAEMFDDAGEAVRIVVLLKTSGVLKGYSGPLDGRALHLVLGPDSDMPPEPK